jgi:hypothetical protein
MRPPQDPLPRSDRKEEGPLDPTERTSGWKAILNALTIRFGDRLDVVTNETDHPSYTRPATVPFGVNLPEDHS